MACPGRLGIGLGVGFGCFLLILGAEVYYLIWRKKRITDTSNDPTETEKVSTSPGRSYYARQLLFRWKKHIPILRPSGHSHRDPVDAKDTKQDPELGVGAGKCSSDDTEESVDSELMRLHNLSGPPRFLFTIKEETREDLDSNDARSRKGSRARSLSDLVMSLDTPFLTPLSSPPLKSKEIPTALFILPDSYDNPLFDSRPPPSPPPKFKFLRDAEKKLHKRIKEEAEAKLRVTQKSIDASEEPQAVAVAAALTSSQVVPLEMESSPTAARPPPDNKICCPVS